MGVMHRVIYAIDIEAESAESAAKKAAELLGTPGVPGRGSYLVINRSTNDITTVDLGEEEF